MKKFLIFLLIFSITVPCFSAPSDNMSEYLLAAKNDGVIFGNENGDLNEDKVAVRAEFLAILVRFLGLSGGENVFSDVKDDDWYAESIAAAYMSGVFAGYDDGTARPNDMIKTEDAIAIIGRYYNVSAHKGRYSGVSDYAEGYFGYAFENGIFSAWKHLPSPKQGITKGEIVSVLYRFREENAENMCFSTGYPKLSEIQSFNTLSVDIKTAEDCAVYYALCEKGEKDYNWIEISKNLKEDTEKTVSLSADINRIYDLYIKAVSKSSGRTRIREIKNVAPLAFVIGGGTETRPYVIYTENQLAQISCFPDKAYALGENIKISGKWTPIENFSGILSGEGYRISGFSTEDNGTDIGIFADINGGTVKNLTVDANVKAKNNAGIIAGQNNGVIEGCCVTGRVEVTNNNGGGFCGINRGEIKNCLSCAYTVKAGSFAGGIAGRNMGKISDCLSAAETVSSEMYAGGISGQNDGGKIENCVAADVAVYNTMTHNGGRISTNHNDGEMRNNFSLYNMVSNAAVTDESADSRNGLETEWDMLRDPEFYFGIGWSRRKWQKADGDFELICPKDAAEPILESGVTPYLPKKIYSQDELLAIAKNGKGHYVLASDITLRAPWKTIDIRDGFTGTLDGNGHTIYNLILKGESGMFSNISGGTVKNLKLSDAVAYQNFEGGIIAACNYGYIENCKVSGTINAPKSSKAGGIAGENNGRISDCSAVLEITGGNTAVGGICVVNNAVIERCSFSGKIEVSGKGAAVGGICAEDNEGYISESAADADISVNGENIYVSGVCAKSAGSQIYKCASAGLCEQSGKEIYFGGICALSEGATIYNSFSAQSVTSSASDSDAGGICAVAEGVNIQNTYSIGRIALSDENTVSGGICAVADGSYISQNVALNPAVSAKKAAGMVAECSECDVSDNYICSRMIINRKPADREESVDSVKNFSELFDVEFYLAPLSQGGLLGWDSTAWRRPVSDYMLPVLTDTPLMDRMKNPKY